MKFQGYYYPVDFGQYLSLKQLAEACLPAPDDPQPDCYGASLIGDIQGTDLYLLGESSRGNRVELITEGMTATIFVDSTRAALQEPSNRAGEILASIARIIPLEAFTEELYKSRSTNPELRRYWWRNTPSLEEDGLLTYPTVWEEIYE